MVPKKSIPSHLGVVLSATIIAALMVEIIKPYLPSFIQSFNAYFDEKIAPHLPYNLNSDFILFIIFALIWATLWGIAHHQKTK